MRVEGALEEIRMERSHTVMSLGGGSELSDCADKLMSSKDAFHVIIDSVFVQARQGYVFKGKEGNRWKALIFWCHATDKQ